MLNLSWLQDPCWNGAKNPANQTLPCANLGHCRRLSRPGDRSDAKKRVFDVAVRIIFGFQDPSAEAGGVLDELTSLSCQHCQLKEMHICKANSPLNCSQAYIFLLSAGDIHTQDGLDQNRVFAPDKHS
jgi:hypothetical protein